MTYKHNLDFWQVQTSKKTTKKENKQTNKTSEVLLEEDLMDTFQNQKQLNDYQSIQNKNRIWSETGKLVVSKSKHRHPEISWNLGNWGNTEKSQVPGDSWGKDVM